MYIYIYIYDNNVIIIMIHVYIYIYIYVYKEPRRAALRDGRAEAALCRHARDAPEGG